ncbi:hypothetical protein BXZ70DRAFT_902932 [Cristinia sonorae]|uniref:Uncharacterized protein n=1 Tax=Cristinia sonorae TaxID=1940300 RepID=A0A8K0UDB5_9AGAR|nr:hypothetical protein BXZ70DRAFT_902932 [Cristinia sonorae]
MAIQARAERRSRPSQTRRDVPHQSASQPFPRHDVVSQVPSQDHSHASSSRKRKSSKSSDVLRVLTLLIEDTRTNPPDCLLAEVRVPLRDAGEGYWADAKDVCDELQIGPSRIDGPAKVYAMRGKYKHIFLRVTSEGGNDCTPANLKVSPERTLEVFIEHVSHL